MLCVAQVIKKMVSEMNRIVVAENSFRLFRASRMRLTLLWLIGPAEAGKEASFFASGLSPHGA